MVDLGSAMGNLNLGGSVASMVYWGTQLLLGGAVSIAFFAFYHFSSFKIKAEVYPLYGSGQDGIFSVGKTKKNRVKWNKGMNSWKKLYPLFNRKTIEPFDQEYIYPGNNIKVFELNDQWIPGRINITQSEMELRAEINPVPHYIRNWQSLEHKRIDAEFADQDFWSQNKYFLMVLLTAGLCLLMVGITVYFTYQFASGGTETIDSLTAAIQGFGQVAANG